jgi:hypothetical protein
MLNAMSKDAQATKRTPTAVCETVQDDPWALLFPSSLIKSGLLKEDDDFFILYITKGDKFFFII